MRRAQGRFRGLPVMIVGQRLLDQIAQRLGMEQGPPIGSQVGARA